MVKTLVRIHEAIERTGFVPDDIAVIGFGNQDFSSYTNPSTMTTVRVDLETLGFTAADAIIDSLRGNR